MSPYESTCDVCHSTAVADCIGGEMYLCAEHLAAWNADPTGDPDKFLASAMRAESEWHVA